jgi:hypothetical protein
VSAGARRGRRLRSKQGSRHRGYDLEGFAEIIIYANLFDVAF